MRQGSTHSTGPAHNRTCAVHHWATPDLAQTKCSERVGSWAAGEKTVLAQCSRIKSTDLYKIWIETNWCSLHVCCIWPCIILCTSQPTSPILLDSSTPPPPPNLRGSWPPVVAKSCNLQWRGAKLLSTVFYFRYILDTNIQDAECVQIKGFGKNRTIMKVTWQENVFFTFSKCVQIASCLAALKLWMLGAKTK